MPRFFFHICQATGLIRDAEGTLLPDLDAAHEEAIASARQILSDKIRAGEVLNGQSFEITDETGQVVGVVPFKSAVRFG